MADILKGAGPTAIEVELRKLPSTAASTPVSAHKAAILGRVPALHSKAHFLLKTKEELTELCATLRISCYNDVADKHGDQGFLAQRLAAHYAGKVQPKGRVSRKRRAAEEAAQADTDTETETHAVEAESASSRKRVAAGDQSSRTYDTPPPPLNQRTFRKSRLGHKPLDPFVQHGEWAASSSLAGPGPSTTAAAAMRDDEDIHEFTNDIPEWDSEPVPDL